MEICSIDWLLNQRKFVYFVTGSHTKTMFIPTPGTNSSRNNYTEIDHLQPNNWNNHFSSPRITAFGNKHTHTHTTIDIAIQIHLTNINIIII